MTEPTTEDIQEWYDGDWRYICIPDKNTLIGILLKRLKDAKQTHKTLLVCAMDDQDKLEEAEDKIEAWKGAYDVAVLENKAAEATIKEIAELPEKWRYHGDGECNCLTCVCANELQAILNRSKS